MTPDPAPGQAEAAMQFITDQQANFATALLTMQNHLEQITAFGRRMEAELDRLNAKVDRLGEAAQRGQADSQSAAAERSQLRQEIAALRSALEAGRHAA